MAATDTRLTPPVALAVVVGLADVFLAWIGWSEYTGSGTTEGAGLYLLGAEAAAGVIVLLLAVVAAGRLPALATTAAGLAWLRLVAVVVAILLIVFKIDYPQPLIGNLILPVVFSVVDAVAGVLLGAMIARRTRARRTG